MGLIKTAFKKISGIGNPRYAQNVVNFYSMLEATSKKGFDVVLENLMGPCFW